MGYRALATSILVVHFGYLVYVIAGGFLAWRWHWLIVPHVLAALWGFLVVTFPWTCPLTAAEDWARRRGGQPALTQGFIDRYITGVLYPPRFEVPLRFLVGAVVLGSWLGALWRWRTVRA